MTFSAWLRAAARQRLEAGQRVERFESLEDVNRFFEECDAKRGAGVEPDWEEHKRAIEESRLQGLPNTWSLSTPMSLCALLGDRILCVLALVIFSTRLS